MEREATIKKHLQGSIYCVTHHYIAVSGNTATVFSDFVTWEREAAASGCGFSQNAKRKCILFEDICYYNLNSRPKWKH